MSAHQKHTALSKPITGNFGRTEIAILGTPCVNIQQLSDDIISALSGTYSIGYVDADHKSFDEAENGDNSLGGVALKFTDKIGYHEYSKEQDENPFSFRKQFLDQDLVIINGNHFVGRKQVLVIDPKKDLSKKLDRITDVELILLNGEDLEIPEFLEKHLKEIESKPEILQLDNKIEIINYVENLVRRSRASINGLVLAGGLSKRMQKDKGLISYHGLPQREHTANLLSEFCESVYISCRPDQSDEIKSTGLIPLEDSFHGLGPFGGILSAFRFDPNAAWLVIACDLPFLDSDTIKQLIDGRNPSKAATAFWDPEHKFPEPLISIWEPKSYSQLLFFLGQGYSCPRKVLINSFTELLECHDIRKLSNVNHPEELENAIAEING